MRYIGIDLGTTNSVITEYSSSEGSSAKITVLKVAGHEVTPSIVSFDRTSGQCLVGHEAKSRRIVFPEDTISSIKREMGNRAWEREFFGNVYTPVDISAEILKKMKNEAESSSGEEIEHVVITVPAYFSDIQRRHTKEAGGKAGLEVLQLISEPMAAALAHGWDRKIAEQTLLVYDLGGGTFDTCCLEIEGNTIRELGVKGDMKLGGDDFDNAIVDYLADRFKQETRIDLKNPSGKDGIDDSLKQRSLRILKDEAEKAKIALSTQESVLINIPVLLKQDDIPMSLSVEITGADFEAMISHYIDRTMEIVSESLDAAKKDPDDISRVLLVGGSTCIPLVKRRIKEFIKEPYISPDAATVVAQGAALHAWNLALPKPLWTSEPITTRALGIRAILGDEQDHFEVLVEGQTPISKAKAERVFQVEQDGQKEVEILVFQGDEPICSKNLFIGGGLLTGLRNTKRGEDRIKVTFRMDDENIMQVSAFDLVDVGKIDISLDTTQPAPPLPMEKPRKRAQNYSIALLLDTSSSMEGEKIRDAKKALISFLDAIDLAEHKVALVTFGKQVNWTEGLTQDRSSLEYEINALEAAGLTPMMRAIRTANENVLRGAANPVIVMATDGIPNDDPPEDILEYAASIKENGIWIITIGIGDNVEDEFLRDLASSPADYHFAKTSFELKEIYRKVASGLVVGKGT